MIGVDYSNALSLSLSILIQCMIISALCDVSTKLDRDYFNVEYYMTNLKEAKYSKRCENVTVW
jgi:hypothetical protein